MFKVELINPFTGEIRETLSILKWLDKSEYGIPEEFEGENYLNSSMKINEYYTIHFEKYTEECNIRIRDINGNSVFQILGNQGDTDYVRKYLPDNEIVKMVNIAIKTIKFEVYQLEQDKITEGKTNG